MAHFLRLLPTCYHPKTGFVTRLLYTGMGQVFYLAKGYSPGDFQEAVMSTLIELKKKLDSWDNRTVLQAVEELRVRGWLGDGSLDGVPLCDCNLEGADLLKARLRKVDLHRAHLQGADLSMADLTGAKLSRARLQDANFSQAILKDVDLYKANLAGARNLTGEQLAQAKRLYGATMPDGSVYDGRFNLPGDLDFAHWGRVDAADPQAMAEFLGVSLEDYLKGQRSSVKVP
jgi:hypothetical protein